MKRIYCIEYMSYNLGRILYFDFNTRITSQNCQVVIFYRNFLHILNWFKRCAYNVLSISDSRMVLSLIKHARSRYKTNAILKLQRILH